MSWVSEHSGAASESVCYALIVNFERPLKALELLHEQSRNILTPFGKKIKNSARSPDRCSEQECAEEERVASLHFPDHFAPASTKEWEIGGCQASAE